MTRDPAALRAVTFDLGDTLWHFPDRPPPEEMHQHLTRRLEHLLQAWAVEAPISTSELQAQLTQERSEAERSAESQGSRGPDYLAIVRQVLGKTGLSLGEEQIHEVWQAQNVGGDFLGRRMFDDTIPTLEWLRERGIRIAALTNRSHGGAAFLEELRREGLLHYFEAVISSDQVGYRKPHPAIFQRVLDVLGLPPEACAHVGDRLEVDVAGARRAGMVTVWMRRLRPVHEQPTDPDETPDHIVNCLAEIKSVGPFS